jgi:hypothetical protein
LSDWIDGREATEPAATLEARGLLRRVQRFRHAYTGPERMGLAAIRQADLKVRLYADQKKTS